GQGTPRWPTIEQRNGAFSRGAAMTHGETRAKPGLGARGVGPELRPTVVKPPPRPPQLSLRNDHGLCSGCGCQLQPAGRDNVFWCLECRLAVGPSGNVMHVDENGHWSNTDDFGSPTGRGACGVPWRGGLTRKSPGT